MARKSAAARESPKRPPYWDKMVSYAYLRIEGKTQEQAAVAVGRSERTGWSWENDNPDLWRQAKEEARGRWLESAGDAARRAVMRSIAAGNATLGMQLLERIDERLAPAKVRAELTGRDGKDLGGVVILPALVHATPPTVT
jgi:hypothetical protein